MKKYCLTILLFIAPLLEASEEIKSCQKEGKTYHTCMREFEKIIISEVGNLVVRDKNRLILKPIKNQIHDKVLIDGEVKYYLREHYPEQNISLIDVIGWEYFNAYIYHHKYGVYREVFDNVRISEDGDHLLAFGSDFEAGFGINAVAIYKLDDWLELMVRFQSMNFGVFNAEFVERDEAKLEIRFFKEGVNGYAKGECSLIYRHGIWQFKDVDCAKDAECILQVHPQCSDY